MKEIKGIKTDKINKTTSILKEDDTASIVLGSIDSPLKARLPMRKELDDQGCDGSGAVSCTTWLSSTDLTSGGVRGYWSLASAPAASAIFSN